MNVGKRICETLKTIRKQIADANGIVYEPKKCNFKGECRGTCPACEQEVKYIEKQLNARRMLGKAVTIIGVSTGIAALSSCSQKMIHNSSMITGGKSIPKDSIENNKASQQSNDNEVTMWLGEVIVDSDSTACENLAPSTSDDNGLEQGGVKEN